MRGVMKRGGARIKIWGGGGALVFKYYRGKCFKVKVKKSI